MNVVQDVRAPKGGRRWEQLTYTSVDDGRGSGGWQVKQATAGLTPSEQEFLRSRVVTALEPPDGVPRFPTDDAVERLPRRLLYGAGPGGGDCRAYWHTAAAGADATGRPGNVFAHVVLDRFVDNRVGTIRPAELWRSADWLTPFGAAAVAGAVLGDGAFPRPRTVVSLESTLDVLLDPARWRIGVLSVLLDAVVAALGGGPRVVLATETSDDAAWWVASVGYLMSPGTARHFGFSTYERADTLAATWPKGVHLACVPRTDLDAVTGTDLVVVDENESVQLGDVGGAPHRTAAGSVVAVTEWSAMAQVALQDRACAVATVAQIDAIAARVGDRGLHPAWPLAWAVSQDDTLFADAAAESADVLLGHSPQSVHGLPDVLSHVTAAAEPRIGSSAGRAWDAVCRTAGASELEVPFAARLYLLLAPTDPDWLRQPGGAPLPPAYRPDPATLRDLADVIARQARHLRQMSDRARASVELAHNALVLVDFAVRVGVSDFVADADPAALWSLCTDVVVPTLTDGVAGRQLVGATGPVGEATLRAQVRPALDGALAARAGREPEAVGWWLPWEVLDWLHPLGAASVDLTQPVTVLTCDYAVALVQRPRYMRHRLPPLAETAVRALLHYAPHRRNLVLDLLDQLPPLSVLSVAAAFPDAVPADRVASRLSTQRWDPQIEMTVRAFADPAFVSPDTNPDWLLARDVARLRAMCGGRLSAVSQPDPRLRSENVLGMLSRTAGITWSAAVLHEIAAGAVAAAVIAVVWSVERWSTRGAVPPRGIGAAWDGFGGGPAGLAGDGAGWSWTPPTIDDALADPASWAILKSAGRSARTSEVIAQLRDVALPDRFLLSVAIMGVPDFPVPHARVAREPAVHHLMSLTIGTEAVPPIDAITAARFAEGRIGLGIEDAEEIVMEMLDDAPFGRRDLADDHVDVRRFARDRWKQLGGPTTGLLGRALRRNG